MNTNWLSAYLYTNNDLNTVLCSLVIPFLHEQEALLLQPAPYFFIRYPIGGNHIRLRLQTTHPAILTQALNNTCHGHIESLQYVSYEPEINRYGNPQSIAWAEEHFYLSSRTILQWISTKSNTASIQIKALQLHMQLLAATQWPLPALIDLCSHFIKDWLYIFREPPGPFLEMFQLSLAPQQPILFPALEAYQQQLHQEAYYQAHIHILQAYHTAGFTRTQLTGILSSMLHMTHNRLGIQNYEEAYILYCLRAFLIQITQHEQQLL